MSLVGPKYRDGWLYSEVLLALSIILFAWLFDQAMEMNGIVLGMLLLAAMLIALFLEANLSPSVDVGHWLWAHSLAVFFLGWLCFRILEGEVVGVAIMFTLYILTFYWGTAAITMAYQGKA